MRPVPDVGKWARDRGLGTVFGFPGEQADPWILGIESAGLQVVCAATETAAGYMAQGLAMSRKGPTAVIVGGGPGLAMLIPALLSASAEGIPVLALVGQSDGSGFPDTGRTGTRDDGVLRAVLGGAVVAAADFDDVSRALDEADRWLSHGRPAAVTVPVPGSHRPDDVRAYRQLPTPGLLAPVAARPAGQIGYHELLQAVSAGAAGAPLFVDAGQARHAAHSCLPAGSFLDAPRTAPMGLGLCGAIGTAIAAGVPTYAVVGDGSAMMFTAELATAVRYSAQATVVVCVNGVLGGPHARTAALGSPSSLISGVDWTLIAAGYGISCLQLADIDDVAAVSGQRCLGPRLLLVNTPPWDRAVTPPWGGTVTAPQIGASR